MEELNIEDLEEGLKNHGNRFSKAVSDLAMIGRYEFYFLIYRLLKQGKVGATDIAECIGKKAPRVYAIYDKVDKYLKSQNEEV